MFAAEIRKRTDLMRTFAQWQWHLDVPLPGPSAPDFDPFRSKPPSRDRLRSREDKRRHTLPLARRRSRRRGAGSLCHKTPGSPCSIEVFTQSDETIWQSRSHRHRQTSIVSRRHEGHRKRRQTRCWEMAQQSGREQPLTVPKTGAGHAQIQANAKSSKVRCRPLSYWLCASSRASRCGRRGPQSLQSREAHQ